MPRSYPPRWPASRDGGSGAVKAAGGSLWLGLTRSARSTRPYGSAADIGRMVSRTAFNQLHHSYALLAATIIALFFTYLVSSVIVPWTGRAIALFGRRPFVLITFVFFTLFPVTLLWAHSFAWLALAFVVRGLKEFGEPARKALIIGEAAPELRARTYGAYYLIRDCTVTSGSFLGAWLWSVSPQANFIGATICGALGTLWFWWFIYRKKNN